VKYSASNLLGGTQQNLSTAYKTIVSLTAESTTNGVVRGKLYDVLCYADTAPADNTLNFDVSRQTAAGTCTGITQNALDPGDVAGRTAAEANYTAEGTITANSGLLPIGLNQRGTMRFTVSPGGELVWPATDENGLAVRAKSPAYTSTVVVETKFEE
jgi:hypothetical protein